DLAEAFLQALDTPQAVNRVFKIAGPEVFTLSEIVELVARVLGMPVRIKYVPFWLANAAFSLMALLTGSRGGKDFLYRMSRDSVTTEAEQREVSEVFKLELKRLAPWLGERIGVKGET
ncbi:hypothetical protein ACFL43_07340, partial [Thermodesulfobacteriota bacterium]